MNYPINLSRGVTETPRRARSRKMNPEERSDWEAVDRALREITTEIVYLRKAVKELQDASLNSST